LKFDSITSVEDQLRANGYLPNKEIATVVYLAARLEKPVLIEGPAGTGKTELAKTVAAMTAMDLIRLQCYEGLDESKALYEWNYRKQLLRIQATKDVAGEANWDLLSEDIFSEEYLLERPLLRALRTPRQSVLLIDEVDRLEVEAEALLLEVLSDFQVSIPELGTVAPKQIPLVFLTSNGTRDLSEALKRRCLFLYIDYPDIEREKEIIDTKITGVEEALARQIAEFVSGLRALDIKKKPSISETLDWAASLLEMGVGSLDKDIKRETLSILLKYRSDIDAVRKHLDSKGRGIG
jgi:MoxR-like ATPase